MVKDSTSEDASAGSSPEVKSCKGLLYLSSSASSSSSRKRTAHNPLCLGLTRPHDRVDSAGKIDVAKHGKAVRDFKYACMGYSVYRSNQAPSMHQSDKCAELPTCTGIKMFVEGQAPEVTGAAASRQGHLNGNSHRNNEGPSIMSRPPSAIRPIRGVTPEEFSTKFIRSAGVVAAALKKNLSRVGRSIKEMVGDIIHPDGSRPK